MSLTIRVLAGHDRAVEVRGAIAVVVQRSAVFHMRICDEPCHAHSLSANRVVRKGRKDMECTFAYHQPSLLLQAVHSNQGCL